VVGAARKIALASDHILNSRSYFAAHARQLQEREILTCRLQGDASVPLNPPILPAKWHHAGGRAAAGFRLIWADFGWVKANEACRWRYDLLFGWLGSLPSRGAGRSWSLSCRRQGRLDR
jgi:hypothetical protein